MTDDARSRREFLLTTGVTTLGVGLAGCTGGDGDDGDGGGGRDYTESEQRVVDYLRADPSEDTFDGEFADETGSDAVSVAVGAEGNQANYAFAPPALKVSSGTTVSWEWTGKGGRHNVVSVPDSDVDFDSGDPKASGEPFELSFDEAGVGLYECEPHAGVGMKGGLVVVE